MKKIKEFFGSYRWEMSKIEFLSILGIGTWIIVLCGISALISKKLVQFIIPLIVVLLMSLFYAIMSSAMVPEYRNSRKEILQTRWKSNVFSVLFYYLPLYIKRKLF
ncbi:MAG: hypothetical protein ABIJ43_05755 [Candidatus Beckwithbacteria bacterium]